MSKIDQILKGVNPKKQKTDVLFLRVKPILKEKLTREAEKRKISVSDLIEKIFEFVLEDTHE